MSVDTPLISVIVPIYMIDRYVGICIESIINQTYQNLQIILVDDGSRDRCAEICDLYARKDNRIQVIHKPNGGLANARKSGVRAAKGEYVAYVDGDDWIGSGFIAALYSSAASTKADIVCAGQTRDLFNKTARFVDALPAGLYEGQELEILWKSMLSYGDFYRPGISTYVWNKLFKRDILSEVQLAVDGRITIGEDAAVTYPALLRCKRVAVVDCVAYHYRQREDSMLKQSASYVDEAARLSYLYDYLLKWSESTELKLYIKNQVTDYLLSLAIMRSGGRLPHDDYSTFDSSYYGKDVAIYSAGTFGQQLINRFHESGHCNVVAWLDDDYWEYRRCCMDVDPVESVTATNFDYILIATVNREVGTRMQERLLDLGVSQKQMLMVTVPEDRESLVKRFLDVDALRLTSDIGLREVISHA